MSSLDSLHQSIYKYWKRENQVENIGNIYQIALIRNLLWRKEILEFNDFDFSLQNQLENQDYFWDMTEIDSCKQQPKSLTLTNSGIQALPKKLTFPLTVDRLDLSANQLQNIPYYWWMEYFKNLKILRLAKNDIQSINWNYLAHIPNLKVLDLRENPLNEDWLQKFDAFQRITMWQLDEFII